MEWLGAGDNPNGKGWAVPGKGYGGKIVTMLKNIIAQETPQRPSTTPEEPEAPVYPQWQTDGLKALVEAGIINSPEVWEAKFDEPITVGQILGILGRMCTPKE